MFINSFFMLKVCFYHKQIENDSIFFPILELSHFRAIPFRNMEGGDERKGGLVNVIFCMWCLEIAILCMLGCRKCHFFYVEVSKKSFLCEGLKSDISGIFAIYESLEKSSPFPFFIRIALIHNLENESILRIFVLFTFGLAASVDTSVYS